MSVIVKVMGNCDTSDRNNAKPFTLHVVPDRLTTIEFNRDSLGRPTLEFVAHGDKDQRFIDYPGGNVYVMDNGNTIATYAYSCGFGKDDVDRMYADVRATTYGEVLDTSGELDDNLIRALLEIRLIDRDIKQTRNIEFVKSDNPNFVSHVNRLLQELFTGNLTAYYAGAGGKIIAIVK
ncbi:hypothetical protein FMC13_00795 [Salmonella enterica subsp. enterica serovar Enteritidis]|nr:hypothetical protein [Shigella flexneri]EIC3923260.1 hypothetical protein [Salmonella enterica]MBD6168904.1 hypothetical protein [Salmonella enterica subsp. enterica serovar Enteritidis]